MQSLWIGQLFLPGSNFLQFLSGLASSPYLDQNSCNLSLWIGQLSIPASNFLDWPALLTWIKLPSISLWIGQLSIPRSNFLQFLSGLASSFYLDQTSCNLSVNWPVLHTWIKLLAISLSGLASSSYLDQTSCNLSLWIGQLSIPGSNF